MDFGWAMRCSGMPGRQADICGNGRDAETTLSSMLARNNTSRTCFMPLTHAPACSQLRTTWICASPGPRRVDLLARWMSVEDFVNACLAGPGPRPHLPPSRPSFSPLDAFTCGMSLSPGEVGIGQGSPRRGAGWPHQPPRSATTCMPVREARSLRTLQSPLDLSFARKVALESRPAPFSPPSPPLVSPHPHSMQSMCMRSHVSAKTPHTSCLSFPFHYECICTSIERLDPGIRIPGVSGPRENGGSPPSLFVLPSANPPSCDRLGVTISL
ncbi:hypothetical protein LY76DRAFT_400165 [Colletotrichum caudatum]|nr:hypothetical protein LY76DRAFT_400165 [Colletotrichum caudatum]